MRRDLDEVEPETQPHRCEHGWVQVTAEYARRLTPDLETIVTRLASLPHDGDEYRALYPVWREIKAKREGLENTWYPCQHCNVQAFHRWRLGCGEPHHDRAHCENCRGR